MLPKRWICKSGALSSDLLRWSCGPHLPPSDSSSVTPTAHRTAGGRLQRHSVLLHTQSPGQARTVSLLNCTKWESGGARVNISTKAKQLDASLPIPKFLCMFPWSEKQNGNLKLGANPQLNPSEQTVPPRGPAFRLRIHRISLGPVSPAAPADHPAASKLSRDRVAAQGCRSPVCSPCFPLKGGGDRERAVLGGKGR